MCRVLGYRPTTGFDLVRISRTGAVKNECSPLNLLLCAAPLRRCERNLFVDAEVSERGIHLGSYSLRKPLT